MNCTMRKACTEQDYYDIRTACDDEHKVWGHCFEKKYIKQFILIAQSTSQRLKILLWNFFLFHFDFTPRILFIGLMEISVYLPS